MCNITYSNLMCLRVIVAVLFS